MAKTVVFTQDEVQTMVWLVASLDHTRFMPNAASLILKAKTLNEGDSVRLQGGDR